MVCYIISYDLRGKKDYDSLYEKIKSYKKWAHILESTWGIVTSKSASELRDDLASVMDNDDGLFVIKSGKEAAWQNVLCKDKWLKDNL